MNARRRIHRIACALLAGAALLMTGCDLHPKEWKTPNMTELSPRLQPLFEKTRTVCFSRFLIDLPEQAEVSWGGVTGIVIYENEAATLDRRDAEREAELKAERRFPLSKNLFLYFETVDGAVKGQRTIISQEDFDSTGMLRMDSYFAMGPHLVKLQALPLEESKDRALGMLNSIASRLRPRAEDEIPTERGMCIEHGFLADPAEGPPDDSYVVTIGFWLKEFPDVNLSILMHPSNSDLETFQSRWEGSRNKPKGPNILPATILRAGPRQTHDWTGGFEALASTRNTRVGEQYSHAHHEFALEFPGVEGDALKPRASIQFDSAATSKSVGRIPASVTDAEAVAIWDRLTGSIRARPVGIAATKISETSPRRPLGERAVTGRLCTQTGIWECEDVEGVVGPRRLHFEAGQPMPRITRTAKPSLWQKLRGAQPTYAGVTVWTLVGYAEAEQEGRS